MNEVLRNEITTQLGFSNRIDVEGTEYYEWVITSTRPFSWILYVKNPNRSAARWLGFKRNTWPRSQVKTETGTGIGGILGRFCNRTGTSNDAERARNGLDSVLIQFDQICVLVLCVPLSSDVCVLLLNEPKRTRRSFPRASDETAVNLFGNQFTNHITQLMNSIQGLFFNERCLIQSKIQSVESCLTHTQQLQREIRWFSRSWNLRAHPQAQRHSSCAETGSQHVSSSQQNTGFLSRSWTNQGD